MSIAWGSIVLLILLLPGFLYSVAVYFPEQFTRETAQRGPLNQLAGILLASLLIHALLYLLVQASCPTRWPCVDLTLVVETITAEKGATSTAREIANNIAQYRAWIVTYFVFACGLGLFSGWSVGRLVVAGWMRGLAQHTWVYDLTLNRDDQVTVAYLMTNVQHEERVLLYRGFLKAFGLQQDGRFSYVVLTDAVKYYMHLDKTRPRTTARHLWQQIGESTPSSVAGNHPASEPGTREWSYLVVEGADIANVVFDRYALVAEKDFDLTKLLQAYDNEIGQAFGVQTLLNDSGPALASIESAVASEKQTGLLNRIRQSRLWRSFEGLGQHSEPKMQSHQSKNDKDDRPAV